jgi:hypothetical protein
METQTKAGYMHVADMIARLAELGFTVPVATIDYYAKHGAAPEGTIGPDYDDALSDALEQVFDEFEIRGGGDDPRVRPSDSRAESQAGSNGPSGSLNPSPRRAS